MSDARIEKAGFTVAKPALYPFVTSCYFLNRPLIAPVDDDVGVRRFENLPEMTAELSRLAPRAPTARL